jgi:hypothetical protein
MLNENIGKYPDLASREVAGRAHDVEASLRRRTIAEKR